MAFSKIDGFEVTPVRASSSIMRRNWPEATRARLIVSSQMETPASCSCWSRFIEPSLVGSVDDPLSVPEGEVVVRASRGRSSLLAVGQLDERELEGLVPPIAEGPPRPSLDGCDGATGLGALAQALGREAHHLRSGVIDVGRPADQTAFLEIVHHLHHGLLGDLGSL